MGTYSSASLTVRRAIWKTPGKDSGAFPGADQIPLDAPVWRNPFTRKLPAI